MIKNKYTHELICDICGETEFGFEKFDDAVDFRVDNGWIREKNCGEWKDICPECQGVTGN